MDIDPNALKVLYRLHKAGHQALLVGGCVRDLLLGHPPKDFDIATSAHPEEVRRLFRNSRLIGRRFRLAHIVFGTHIIEVATFRTHHGHATQSHHAQSRDGMIVRDNVYGTIDDDAFRRDFTVNALYYNIADFSVVDYTGGMEDIQKKQLRIIGDAEKRFLEDPVRLIRAVRFMGKLGFHPCPATETSLGSMNHLLLQVSSARLFQEIMKIFHEGSTTTVFHLLEKYNLFPHLFGLTADCLSQPLTRSLLEHTLTDTDERIREGKQISAAFLLTALLWQPICQAARHFEQEENLPPRPALEKAIKTSLEKQTQQLAITRAIQAAIREIILLQHDFTHQRGKKPFRTASHPRFRAALDLLLLRVRSGESLESRATWWTAFHEGDQGKRESLLQQAAAPQDRKKRRTAGIRRSSRRRPPRTTPQEKTA